MITTHWPLLGLSVETPRLTLRYPDDALVADIADLAAEGIHDPSWMPFSFPWTDVEPPLLQRNTVQFLWQMRAAWSATNWHLQMAVLVDGAVVGVQAVLAEDFEVLRTASTGSWLGRRYQGKGIGKEMRAAILHLVFAGLGASYALSSAFEDNAASLAVTRRLGYEESGRRQMARRGEPAWMIDFRMSRERWEQRRRDDITITGLEPCRALFESS